MNESKGIVRDFLPAKEAAKYLDIHEAPNLKEALDRAKTIKISFFENFNHGLQNNLDSFGIPINVKEKNKAVTNGIPTTQLTKQLAHGAYYGAPEKLIKLIKDMNSEDIILYEKLRRKP